MIQLQEVGQVFFQIVASAQDRDEGNKFLPVKVNPAVPASDAGDS
jgi:hypothetical protein